ncbi:type II toxin-antitoxin system HicA family toxin [Natrarchaeobius chitinivorans]|uniref:Type II toxin-antitoxin system HicA family toxin n=1 Tax=Natrarchaeobius chitinivorans TaxID=1679083 RepID=A0A3N6LKV7_NATCH|nr:type II toxin-antitoxin system HicA family toxin [Natrarchaeobius chitinivorans]RQG89338.1 type II toxin-antitoxin system HicA family toxin [Natrarchaeobius chitinivorans]
MATRDFSGQDVIKVLRRYNYRPVGRTGSHVRLRYEVPETDEVRLVSVPMHDRIREGTLRNIADQCAARDFEAWCEWIDENR